MFRVVAVIIQVILACLSAQASQRIENAYTFINPYNPCIGARFEVLKWSNGTRELLRSIRRYDATNIWTDMNRKGRDKDLDEVKRVFKFALSASYPLLLDQDKCIIQAVLLPTRATLLIKHVCDNWRWYALFVVITSLFGFFETVYFMGEITNVKSRRIWFAAMSFINFYFGQIVFFGAFFIIVMTASPYVPAGNIGNTSHNAGDFISILIGILLIIALSGASMVLRYFLFLKINEWSQCTENICERKASFYQGIHYFQLTYYFAFLLSALFM